MKLNWVYNSSNVNIKMLNEHEWKEYRTFFSKDYVCSKCGMVAWQNDDPKDYIIRDALHNIEFLKISCKEYLLKTILQ